MGKMILEGPRCHPLFKLLKKNCMDFYDHDRNIAKKNLSEVGLFIWDGKNSKYWSEN